ncbi:hypothetical protein ACIO8G_00520 [Streptomyces sp. NPDC087219]
MGSELRNGPHGYGIVTKTMRRTLFAALAAQFAVGHLLRAAVR